MAQNENLRMEAIVSLCKRRGFIYQSSEIYGGINGFWDYGPLGCELKKNVKDSWWKRTVRLRGGPDEPQRPAPFRRRWIERGHVVTSRAILAEPGGEIKRFAFCPALCYPSRPSRARPTPQ